MSRVIRYFKIDDESYAGEFILPEIDLNKLQTLFSLDESEPMYECFEIKESQSAFFQSYVSIEFNFKKYDYFLYYEN